MPQRLRQSKTLGSAWYMVAWAVVPLAFAACGEESEQSKSIALPQPFTVSFRHEDLNIIAFLADHPEYESVEAMIARRADREPLVRAIITRHDKTQVDHINDQDVAEEHRQRDPLRETHYSPMEFREALPEGLPHVFLRFQSFHDEEIVFDFYAATRAFPAFGGLTDPLGHARTTTLPVMWREASTLGSDLTSVRIDGQRYDIQVGVVSGSLTGLQAYYTEGFLIGTFPVTTGEARSGARAHPSRRWRRMDVSGQGTRPRLSRRRA